MLINIYRKIALPNACHEALGDHIIDSFDRNCNLSQDVLQYLQLVSHRSRHWCLCFFLCLFIYLCPQGSEAPQRGVGVQRTKSKTRQENHETGLSSPATAFLKPTGLRIVAMDAGRRLQSVGTRGMHDLEHQVLVRDTVKSRLELGCMLEMCLCSSPVILVGVAPAPQYSALRS